MPVSLNNTQIVFNDGTTQTTAGNNGFGNDFRYENLTASRAANINYQNTSGLPMYVSVNVNSDVISFLQTSPIIAAGGWRVLDRVIAGATHKTLCGVVPVGHYFKLVTTGSVTIHLWIEGKS